MSNVVCRQILLAIMSFVYLFGMAEFENRVEHVILIGIDGFSSTALTSSYMPTLEEMMKDGSFTLRKRSVLPSSSAPNWASMFMGVPTEMHGYTQWGSKEPEIPSPVEVKNNIFPTIFQVLRDERPNYEIGCLYEWDGIKHLVDTLSLNYHAIAEDYAYNEDLLADLACKYVKEKRPNFLAVIFDGADHAGHYYGYESEEYYRELNFIDGEISRILDAVVEAGLMEKTVVIVTSDHGGVGKSHGGITLDELETPFIICGRGIRKGYEINELIIQYDIAAIIADIFCIYIPANWRGRSVDSMRDYGISGLHRKLSIEKHRETHYYDMQGREYTKEPDKGIFIRSEVNFDGSVEVEKFCK